MTVRYGIGLGGLWLAALAGCTEPADGTAATGTPLLRPVDAPTAAESSDPPAYRLERVGPSGLSVAVPGAERVLAAAPLRGGTVAFVTHEGFDGTLALSAGDECRTLDTAVVPELAVSPDGTRLLYPRRAGDDVELVLAEPSRGRREVVGRGPTADRPVFRPDGEAFAFVGTNAGGLASLFVIDGPGPARQVTNVGLQGPGLPAGFVPPPLRAGDLAWDGGRLVYPAPDGRRCEVDLAAARGTCAEVRP
ncbi:MAG: hypothetical protein JXB32_21970 [Deltaproteobacteria bacterium]|nr:hypothetical protein [Deltaproteobacteria bacterium]